MKHRALRSLLALVALNLFTSLGSADEPAPLIDQALAPMSGEQIFQHICQACHMAEAQGATGAGFYPKLAGNKKFVAWEFVALTVLNGRNGMPPFGTPPDAPAMVRANQLSDAQIAEVVNYVRTHFGNRYAPNASAQKVQALPHPKHVALPF
jgi:mono/diheme cytochrome c family protein